MRYVIDASAALAVLQHEPGGQWVAERITDAGISAVNAIEVGTRLVDRGMEPPRAGLALARLRIPIIGFDADLAIIAIGLRDRTRSLGLSLADRACLALALRERAIAVTSDRAWAKLDIGCEIELIR